MRPTEITTQEGLIALQNGDLNSAEAIFLHLLARNSSDPIALQLLGMVRKSQGNMPEAKRLLRQSLQHDRNQPHVWNNLANIVIVDDADEASRLYQTAIALRPDYSDALANLAGINYRGKQYQEAEALYATALRANASHSQSLEGLMLTYLASKKWLEAESACLKYIEARPNHEQGYRVLGDVLAAQESFEAALAAYQNALRLNSEADELWVAMGGCLRALLADSEAFEAFSKALQLNPSNILAHRNLNELLWTYGQTARYLTSYVALMPLLPADAEVRVAYCEDLLQIGEIEKAQAVLSEIESIAPAHLQLNVLKGRIASLQGNHLGAAKLFSTAMQSKPEATAILVLQLDSLMRAHRFQEAQEQAQQALLKFPDDQDILARLSAAIRLSGSSDPLGLWDDEKFVQVLDLDPENGMSVAEFNQQLAVHLKALHVSKNHPLDQTLRGGTQTFGNLFNSDTSDIMKTTVAMFRRAISTYIERLPSELMHPVVTRRQRDFKFSGSWSARLHANGYHTNHIHPEGWLSSAYYVALPDIVDDDTLKQGWFKLGETNLSAGANDLPIRLIQPKVGRLVLFPSFYWHGTTPFLSNEERLTIAFDVVPE